MAHETRARRPGKDPPREDLGAHVSAESTPVPRLHVMQRLVGNQAVLRRSAQRRHEASPPSSLPNELRARLELRSGVSLAHVRVHHDSPEPARHAALAFTRGAQIHLGPGQERHLPHEAWHAVQQRQGRVPVTGQVGGVPLNDDAGLEREADKLGASTTPEPRPHQPGSPAVLQRVHADPDTEDTWISDLHPGAVMKPGDGYIRVTSFSSIADTYFGSLGSRDHAYVAIEYVDAGTHAGHTVFTDLTDKEVRYSDDTSTYVMGTQLEDQGAQMRKMIRDKLVSDEVIGTSYRVTATQAIAAIHRAQEIRGEYGVSNPDGKYSFAKSGTALSEHGINCARFAHKVLKAAGIEVSAGKVAKTPFEVATLGDGSSAMKVIDATSPDMADPAALTKELKEMAGTTGFGSGVLSKLGSWHRKTALDEAGLAAIHDWVKGGWSAMNRYVRGVLPDAERTLLESIVQNGVQAPSFAERVAALDLALASLTAFAGTSYRVATPANSDVYAKKIVPGDFISDKGYWASSLIKGGEGGASSWGASGKVHFEIKGASGRDISQHSPMPGEREVLFGPDVVFKVEAIKVDGDTSFVVIREVVPPTDATIKNSYDGSVLRAPPGPELEAAPELSRYRSSLSSVHL